MIKIAVIIKLKQEVLDTKGRTLLEVIKKEQASVTSCHYGKYIELTLNESDPKLAIKQANDISKTFLCNDLIEDFELKILN